MYLFENDYLKINIELVYEIEIFFKQDMSFAKKSSEKLGLPNRFIHVYLSFSSVSFNSDVPIPQGCHALVKMAISEVKRSHDK